MKVVHLTTVHPPFDTRIFHKEARTLVRAGHDVKLIAQHDKNVVADGVPVIALPKPRNRFTRISELTWQALSMALRERADVYHIHDAELIPISVVLKLMGSRVVYDVHEDLPRQTLSKHYIPSFLRNAVARMAEVMETLASRLFDGIVAATPTIAARFPNEKTITVQNFPMLAEFILPDPMPYEQRPAEFAYVGGLTSERGVWEMLQALNNLGETDIRLQIAGSFSPASLEAAVHAHPGWSRVRFHGWIGRNEVASILGQVRGGIVCLLPAPNYVHAQPIKLFEYMAAALPVVASDFPLWRKIVEESGCGLLVNPKNPEAIAEALRWILDHPKEAEAMGRRGRQAVVDKYNWGPEAKKLIDFYRRLL